MRRKIVKIIDGVEIDRISNEALANNISELLRIMKRIDNKLSKIEKRLDKLLKI